MFSFGLSSAADVLSWTVVLLLGIKVGATALLLPLDASERLGTPIRRLLWWSTKVTPVLAVPCMIQLALLQGRVGEAWLYGGLMIFVLIAVPLVVHRRFRPVDPATRPR